MSGKTVNDSEVSAVIRVCFHSSFIVIYILFHSRSENSETVFLNLSADKCLFLCSLSVRTLDPSAHHPVI